jgi:hypothetical protein
MNVRPQQRAAPEGTAAQDAQMQQPARARLKAHTDPPVAVYSMQYMRHALLVSTNLVSHPSVSQPSDSHNEGMQRCLSTPAQSQGIHPYKALCEAHLQGLEGDGATVCLCGSQMGHHHQYSGATKVAPAAHDIHNDTCRGWHTNIHRSACAQQAADKPGNHKCKARPLPSQFQTMV